VALEAAVTVVLTISVHDTFVVTSTTISVAPRQLLNAKIAAHADALRRSGRKTERALRMGSSDRGDERSRIDSIGLMLGAPTATLPSVGETIGGKYHITGKIAEGGMGLVYEAIHVGLAHPVAIKAIYPHYCMHPDVVRRFGREGRIAARLEGPNVARIYDIDTMPNGILYMVMERLHGEDLEHRLNESGKLPIGPALDFVYQAARAMSEAHALGIIHRDLKPGNLFLCEVPGTERKLVKVLDFGISRFIHEDALKITADLTTLGTPFYMSPEQIRGASTADARSDVWSLGVIVYELLTGRLPFQGKVTEVLLKVTNDAVVPPSTWRDDIPSEIEAIVLRALEKAADARFQSMDELAAALEPYVPAESVESLAARVPRIVTDSTAPIAMSAAPTIPTPGPRRSRARALSIGVACTALALGAVLFRAHRIEPPPIEPAHANEPQNSESRERFLSAPDETKAPIDFDLVTDASLAPPATQRTVGHPRRPLRVKFVPHSSRSIPSAAPITQQVAPPPTSREEDNPPRL
jgi:serine/threonine-protein kinase